MKTSIRASRVVEDFKKDTLLSVSSFLVDGWSSDWRNRLKFIGVHCFHLFHGPLGFRNISVYKEVDPAQSPVLESSADSPVQQDVATPNCVATSTLSGSRRSPSPCSPAPPHKSRRPARPGKFQRGLLLKMNEPESTSERPGERELLCLSLLS
uniref:Uncharacterized protein n=1 Tax=Ascaris lumbricoides TaxID=6252 RepID=A0A0M3HTL4_ASCLU